MRLIDLTGKRFGTLTVLYRDGNIGGIPAWFCVCDCGKTGRFRGSTLRNGMTKSCGCMISQKISEAQREDLTGQTFGFLFVEELDSVAKNRQCKWKCRCLLCGGHTVVYASNLKRGHTVSCGCMSTSKNEVAIDIMLRENGIKYSHGYIFDDLHGPNGGYLEFDFALKDKNNNLLALIEYQGEQHYKEMPNDKHFGQLQREQTDKMKKQYCEQNNLLLYEIKYNSDIASELNSILFNVYSSHVNTVPSAHMNA